MREPSQSTRGAEGGLMYEFGDKVMFSTSSEALTALVISGKSTLWQRLKLAWRIVTNTDTKGDE